MTNELTVIWHKVGQNIAQDMLKYWSLAVPMAQNKSRNICHYHEKSQDIDQPVLYLSHFLSEQDASLWQLGSSCQLKLNLCLQESKQEKATLEKSAPSRDDTGEEERQRASEERHYMMVDMGRMGEERQDLMDKIKELQEEVTRLSLVSWVWTAPRVKVMIGWCMVSLL